MFTIKSIYAQEHDHGYGGYPYKVIVEVEMPAKEFLKYKHGKSLGQLYGIEISNAVYAINRNIPAHNPNVDDSRRSTKGIKSIQLTYYVKHYSDALEIGFKCKQDKSGQWYAAGWNEHINLLSKE